MHHFLRISPHGVYIVNLKGYLQNLCLRNRLQCTLVKPSSTYEFALVYPFGVDFGHHACMNICILDQFHIT